MLTGKTSESVTSVALELIREKGLLTVLNDGRGPLAGGTVALDVIAVGPLLRGAIVGPVANRLNNFCSLRVVPLLRRPSTLHFPW